MTTETFPPGGPVLSVRYGKAVEYARDLHRDDVRKGTRIPYLSHLLSVSALVLEHGGDEDQAIAALLHDAAEDHGGETRIVEIRHTFGERVADIVAACSDSLVEDPAVKAPWRDRKVAYIAHLATTPQDALIVTASDKLHNARAIRADHERHGDEVWSRFNSAAGFAGVCWYYTGLVAALGPRLVELGEDASALARELDRTVEAIRDDVARLHPDLDERMSEITGPV